MEQWIAFAQQNWLIVIAAIIAVLLVIKIVKTIVKWVIVLAIVAGLLFYGANYVDEIKQVGGSFLEEAKNNIRDEALKAMTGQDAVYTRQSDGSFTIVKGQVQLDGKEGSSEVKVTFMGQSITLKVDDALKALIEQAKQNGTSQQ
jgi:hypothetical protein